MRQRKSTSDIDRPDRDPAANVGTGVADIQGDSMREFTKEELSHFNGRDGMPVYIAYNGGIYDVTTSKLWHTGVHMKRHPSGTDLTVELSAAPHTDKVFERFRQVGVLKKGEKEQPRSPEEEYTHLPRFIADMLLRVPFLARHPHPMTVHFPIAFMITSPLFVLLYLATGASIFELSSFAALGAGLFFSLATIPLGFFTWWVNYLCRPVKSIIIKIVLSSVMFLFGLSAFIWRLKDPLVLHHLEGMNIVYLILVLSLAPLVTIVGTYGALLTFPLEKRKR